MMTKISSTSTELGYQLQQQQQNEQIYSNQLMLSSTPPSINCYRKIRSTEDLTTMLTDETTMTTLQQHQSQHLQDHSNLKFSTLNTPATIVDENNHNARALQLALELSIVSLNSEHQNHSMNSSQRLLLNSSIDHQSISKSTNSIMTSNLTQPLQNEHQFQKSFLENSSLALGMIEERTKKSQNMTECVPVPSSEHVAEIVGRQGCKIKALRAKTNTYIKTPVRGEEPVFVVTGRKEDVAKAKREILSAAEHFSLIRAARNPSRQTFTPNATTILPPINDIDCNSENLLDENKLTTHIDASIFKLNESNEKQQQQQQQQQSQQQQITIQVRVPYRVVGLVVGPKGSTIKHIQQETQTYIVTPSREKQPIFEVTGSHENVQLARKQIEAHIAIRTGNLSNSLPPTATPTIYGGTGSGTRIQKQKLCKTIEDDIEYEKNVCLYRSNHNHDEMTLNEFLNDMTTMSSTTSTSTTSATSTETTICTINSLSQMLNEGENLQPEFLETFYRTFDYKENNIQQLREQHQQLQPSRPQQIFKLEKSDNDVFYNEQEQQLNQFLKAQQKQLTSSQTVETTTTTTTTATTMAALLNFNARSSSSASSSTSSKSAQNCYIAVGDNGGLENGVGGGFATNWKHNLGDSLDTDEGISESSLIWVLPTTSSGITTTTLTQSMVSTSTTTAPNTTSTAISPTDSLLCHSSSSSNEIHQNHSQNIFYAKSQQQQQQQQQQPQFKRDSCLICGYQEVSAALIPCGHDLFCLDCAQHICSSLEPNCPICNNNVYQAVRLTS